MDKSITDQMSKYLLSLREGAKLSQQDVAERSNFIGNACHLDQRTVSRLEKDPLSATAINIAAYMNALGREEGEFYAKLKELSCQLGETSMDNNLINQNKHQISSLIEGALSRVRDASGILQSSNEPYLRELNLGEKLKSAKDTLKGLYRKPVIGVFGHYDVGKTTILNTVIGDRILPELYQPATSVVNLIVHEDDKPESLAGCNVAVFRKGFLPHMVNDPSLVKQYLIQMGEYSLLDELGVHDYDEGTNADAYIAIVFSKAEILKNIWLLDTPGHLNEDETGDTEKALTGVELIDGMLFVSRFNGFFDSKDFAFFTQIARHREPVDPDAKLEHIAIVASHCHNSITIDDINNVKRNAYKRLNKQMTEFIFQPWFENGKVNIKPSSSDLECRTFPFWRETPEYKNTLLSEILSMAGHLNNNHEKLVSNAIQRLDDELIRVLTNAQNDLMVKKQGVHARVKELDEQEAKFREESRKITTRFEKLVSSCSSRKSEDIERVLNYYNAHMSAEGLAGMIRANYDDKKEAANSIGALIGQKLNTKVEQTLKLSGESFNNELDLLLNQWQEAAPNMAHAGMREADSIEGLSDVNVSAFDAKAAFIGGMTGLTSLGAMSLYVSTFISSNLGAYILVGQVAGWLTSLGITGSVTSTTSFVAAIGGPVVVGMVLAGILGYGIYRLVGRDWQSSLGKKVRDVLVKEGTDSKLEDPISKFWDSTASAVRQGIDSLIKDTDVYIDRLRKEANTEYDIAALEACIEVIEKMKSAISGSNK